jgi:hypothetical protein
VNEETKKNNYTNIINSSKGSILILCLAFLYTNQNNVSNFKFSGKPKLGPDI